MFARLRMRRPIAAESRGLSATCHAESPEPFQRLRFLAHARVQVRRQGMVVRRLFNEHCQLAIVSRHGEYMKRNTIDFVSTPVCGGAYDKRNDSDFILVAVGM